jgi:Zn-finger nucleic acid-binding protein
MPPQPLNKIRYLPCPDCKQLMNRSNFARASGVIIDTCRQHGVWFDAEELQKIIEFIQKGGMELARRREKRELDEQRAALLDERRRLGVQSQNLDDDFSRDDVLGIRWFIDKLFD